MFNYLSTTWPSTEINRKTISPGLWLEKRLAPHFAVQFELGCGELQFLSAVLCHFPWWKVSFWQRFGMFDCVFSELKADKSPTICWKMIVLGAFSNLHPGVMNTIQGTNISPKNGILKMIFLFPRWDMLIPRRVNDWRTQPKDAEAKASRWDCAIEVLERMMSGAKSLVV